MKKILMALLVTSFAFSSFAEAKRYSNNHVHGTGSKTHHQGHSTKKFHTYIKENSTTKKTYIGRTSGYGNTRENVARRDANHHRNKDGFGPSIPDKTSHNKDAIRGREQQLIEKHRRDGNAADQINGISPKNPRREHYLNEAKKEFGQ